MSDSRFSLCCGRSGLRWFRILGLGSWGSDLDFVVLFAVEFGVKFRIVLSLLGLTTVFFFFRFVWIR